MKFSIITCAYKPNQAFFDRVVGAVQGLQLPDGSTAEYIIVDNNSGAEFEQKFKAIPQSEKIPTRVVTEPKPGLTSARIKGIESSDGEWIVFFDDDNLPQNGYLLGLFGGISKYPYVKAWGAGNIKVEYLGEPKLKSHLAQSFKAKFFQERSSTADVYGHVLGFNPSFYPIGTGLCIERKAITNYLARYNSGSLTIADRTGSSLSSGGDIQMLYVMVQDGHPIGRLAALSLAHLIDARKANINYVLRLTYGTASSYFPMRHQTTNEPTNYISAAYSHKFLANEFGKNIFLALFRFQSKFESLQNIISTLGVYDSVNQMLSRKSSRLGSAVHKWVFRFFKVKLK